MGGTDAGLASVEIGGKMKVSLHRSGRRQYGYTSEYELEERAAGRWRRESRHKRWQRPADVTPGYTLALKIVVPDVVLRPRSALQGSKPIRWMEGKAGSAVVFTIWISKSSIPPWLGHGAPESTILATIPLTTGEFVLLVDIT